MVYSYYAAFTYLLVMSTAAQIQGGDASTELTDDDIFDVLSNRRRRHAVHTIKQHDHEPIEIGDLAEEIAAIENDVHRDNVSYDQRKCVYTALQQSHLPKMDEAGVVKFDKDRGTIEPTPAIEDIEIYLDVVRGDEIPWSQYYLGLSGVAAALVTAAWIEAWPLSLLPEMGTAVIVVVAFTISALVHTYLSRDMKIGTGEAPPEKRS